MWTPYKELQSLVERYITSSPSTHDLQYHEFTEALRNHKQNFLTLLKNPVSGLYNIEYLRSRKAMKMLLNFHFIQLKLYFIVASKCKQQGGNNKRCYRWYYTPWLGLSIIVKGIG